MPAALAEALRDVAGIEGALIFGSWAARLEGAEGKRPVEDIDVLVLGEPDREELYAAIERVESRLGRRVAVTIREPGRLTDGQGTFHDTVVSRPMVPVPFEGTTPSAG